MFRKIKNSLLYIIITNNYIRTYGLTNKSLQNTKIDNNNNSSSEILLNNKIYDFFLFNESGICVLEKQMNTIIKDDERYNKYKLLIKNIAHTLIIHEKKNIQKKKTKDNDKLNLNKNDYIDNEFVFKKIEIEKYKILFLIKNNVILIGTFPKASSTQFQRLLLIHIFIALINIKGDIISTMKKINEYEKYDNNNFINLKSLYNKKSDKLLKENNDILEILLFEYYFLKSIIFHFSKVFNEIFKKEDMNLKQTKFRNLYLLDVHNLSIILDMCKIQGSKSLLKNKKFYKFDKLFEEIIYHAKNLYSEYLQENDMRYTEKGLDFRFVKFECTSTYPRLLFIIKFIPILKGMVVIHIYSQKKLTRSNENLMQTEQGLNFKEVDLLFGSFIKDNPNFEFKYGAPKKLEYVQKFIEEFFITGRNGYGVFRLNTSEKKYKYINYEIVNIINNFQIKNNVDIEKTFETINNKLKEDYEKEKKVKIDDEENETDSNYEDNDDEKEKKILNNLFLLKKESFYNIFFNEKNYSNSFNYNNKNLTSGNEKRKNENIIINRKIDIKKINDIDQNLNINDINSDRKLMENQNKTLSFNSNGIIDDDVKSLSKKSKHDSLSKISIIKMKEIFEIKPVNKKENNIQENKEDTKERRSINSSLNEKGFKINELLDLLTSPKAIEFNKVEKNAILEENEQTKKAIFSPRISKNTLPRSIRPKINIENEKGLDSKSSINVLINQQ
jgi:hypothetical protein